MTPHPECGHDVGLGPDDVDVVCCIYVGNPCPDITVERMVRHREFDIDLWTRPVTTGGGFDGPPF